ncbi:hypothetical protein MPER_11745 [Moniliophthora perniciosa FA553]|nr:hypothetical protein MPER_11745 [Moniliophthora perniciosa FA553]
MQAIEFYDIPSKLPNQAWSPNTWKTRYCLNYKGLSYKTIWVEYPDIEPTCKRLGASWTHIRRDGTLLYTLPIIHDPNTGETISDSPRIAEYLDANYPETPRLFPAGSHALQTAFCYTFERHHINYDVRFIIPKTLLILNPPSYVFFKEAREKQYGSIAMEDFYPKGEEKKELWNKWKDEWTVVDGWLQKNPSGDFVFGETISWADFVIAGWIMWYRTLLGVDSEEWQDFASWHGGRWANLSAKLSRYQSIL